MSLRRGEGRSAVFALVSVIKTGFLAAYSCIKAGAPHSSAEIQQAQTALGGMSRTGRLQRPQAVNTL